MGSGWARAGLAVVWATGVVLAVWRPVGAQPSAGAAQGPAPLPQASGAAGSQLDRVEITGSSLRRIDAEGALPVTVIRVEDLRRQGVTTAEQALARVSANQSALGSSVAVSATTGGKAEADLRGLSAPTGGYANKTLVLLNGRRLANHAFDSAAVDLSAIPLAAVDRIEVLRDGASAIYGTDAIGGVVNFITRRELRGLQLDAEALAPQGGGGATRRLSLSGGLGSLEKDRFNVWGTLDWRRQDALAARQRSFSRTGVVRGGVDGSNTSGTSFPGDVNGFEPSLPGCAGPSSLPSADGSECRYDFARDADLLPRNEQLTALVRGTLALGGGHDATLEVLRARQQIRVEAAPAAADHYFSADSPYWPAGAPVAPLGDIVIGGRLIEGAEGGIVNWREVDAGSRINGNVTTTERVVLELTGDLGDWEYRGSIGRSVNRSRERTQGGYLDDARVQEAVWDGLVNPFGPQTPAGQAALDAAEIRADVRSARSVLDVVDLRLRRDLLALPAGPLSLALGAEYRREQARFDNLDATGLLPSLGLDPAGDTRGERRSGALYAELAVPVTSAFEVSAAARWDRYEGFGDTVNPKLGLRYQPVPELLLRASYGTGFRAPTLYEQHAPAAYTYSSDAHDDPLLCPGGSPAAGVPASAVCNQQVVLRQGQTAGELDPEKSRTWTVGLVFEPVRTLSVGFDYWNVAVRQLIGGLPEQAVFEDGTPYGGRIVRCSAVPAEERDFFPNCLLPGVDGIAYVDQPTENLGELRTDGIDVALRWRPAATPWGRFGVGLDGTWVRRYDYQRESGGERIDALGRYADYAPIFRWQHALVLDWSAGPWAASLVQRYKSGYRDQDPRYRVGSLLLHDLSVSWLGTPNLVLTAGVLNLFDRDPPLSSQITNVQRGYDPRFADPLGRSFLLRAEYRFL